MGWARRKQPGPFSALAHTQVLPTGVGRPATVYYQGVAVHETAELRIGEERDCLRDIIRSGEARHRYAIGDVGIGVGSARLVGVVHRGLDPARTDRVATDPAAAPFGGEC